MNIPGNLRYTTSHEWVRVEADGSLTIGVTDHAQEALGDVVFVALPEVGASVSAGDPCGDVESTKSVSEIYAPVSGTVAARNDAVETAPETVNHEPYEAGWLFDLTPSDPNAVQDLLSAADYEALVQEI